jgi:hypothetical protein
MIFRTGRFINHRPLSGFIGDTSNNNKAIWNINEHSIITVDNKLTPPITLIESVLGAGSATNVQTITFPAHQNGDWLFAVIGSQSQTPPTPPSGWSSAVSVGSADNTRSATLMYRISDGTISTVDFPMVGGSTLLYSSGMVLRNVGGIGGVGTRVISGISTTQAYPRVSMQRKDNTSRVIVGYFFQSVINDSDAPIAGNLTAVGGTHNMAITSQSVSEFELSPFIASGNGARTTLSAEILKA